MKQHSFLSILVIVAAVFSGNSAAATLDDVKARGFVRCGVSQGLAGFSNIDAAGKWTGMDADFCRALAAAIFNDPEKVKFTPLSAKERFTALQSGEVDILARNTTWTMSRDTGVGLHFTGVLYHDGQGLMIPKRLNVKHALELSGAELCTNTGTTTELNIADFFRKNNLPYQVVGFEKSDEAVRAYDSGRCDVYSTDMSGLYAQRLKLRQPDEHVILPEIISKEPLGPAVRQGDAQWFSLVRWTLFALINAEELGVSSQNAEAMRGSTSPEIRRLLGVEGAYGEKLGLTKDWAFNIIRHAGNYGEIYDRSLGAGSVLKIERGLNRLWSQGGILFAPPVR